MAQYTRRPVHYTDERETPPPAVDCARQVFLLHPEHLISGILSFDAVDDGRVLHRVVLDACYVLSGNRKGYLSAQPDGQDRQDEASQPFLLPGSYYYHAEDPAGGHDSHWTIVNSFTEWHFPHEEFAAVRTIPSGQSLQETYFLKHWRTFQITDSERALINYDRSEIMSAAVKSRDSDTCILSAWKGLAGLQNAHLVPGNDDCQEWFRVNNMAAYCRSPPRTREAMADNSNNGITLRRDLSACLDASIWLIFPIHEQRQYGAYFYWGEEAPSAAHFYHGVPLRLHRTTSEAFLFARFAYTVFSRLSPLVRASPPPRKRQRHSQGASNESTSSVSGETADNEESHSAGASRHARRQIDPPPEPVSEAQRLMYLCWEYSAAHPEIDAIGDPSRVSTSEREWRQLLDPDEVEQYYT